MHILVTKGVTAACAYFSQFFQGDEVMSKALSQLKEQKFECLEALEISEYIESILDPEEIIEEQEAMVSYVVSVPFYIENMWQAAAAQDGEAQIKPILENIRNYFFKADDLIPDHHGVIGLLDDAYMVYCFIKELNQFSIQHTGNSFVELDLDYQRQLIAVNLGADIAEQIEADVKSTIDGLVSVGQLKTVGTLLFAGLALGSLAKHMMGGDRQSNSDKWVELFNNRIDHGW